jgi:KRAB domain-containing zinc finger protein
MLMIQISVQSIACIFVLYFEYQSFITKYFLFLQSAGYKCSLCSVILKNKHVYQQHTKAHYGIYRFRCDVCNKGFNGRTHLLNHMAKHTGVKRFPCPTCGKGFAYKHGMQNHMEHSCGKKP